MKKIKRTIILVVLGFAALACLTSSLPAGITNGDFFKGQTGWCKERNVFIAGGAGGNAIFHRTNDPISGTDIWGKLWQPIDLSGDAKMLSFDVIMAKADDSPGGETDNFSARLWQGAGTEPPGTMPIYELKTSVLSWAIDEYAETVHYNLSGWDDGSYMLEFRLERENPDAVVDLTVTLDNVALSIPTIPAPGALLLGGIGSGLVVLLRRKKAALN